MLNMKNKLLVDKYINIFVIKLQMYNVFLMNKKNLLLNMVEKNSA